MSLRTVLYKSDGITVDMVLWMPSSRMVLLSSKPHLILSRGSKQCSIDINTPYLDTYKTIDDEVFIEYVLIGIRYIYTHRDELIDVWNSLMLDSSSESTIPDINDIETTQ